MIIALIIVVLIILGLWYVHKNWVSFSTGKGGIFSRIFAPIWSFLKKIFSTGA